jgi:hypothetical protein
MVLFGGKDSMQFSIRQTISVYEEHSATSVRKMYPSLKHTGLLTISEPLYLPVCYVRVKRGH